MTRSADTAKDACVRCVHLMASGSLADLATVVHPDARNREAAAEPPATRGTGPAALHASALWLRAAFDDLRWEVHDVVAEGDLVVLRATMSGRHVRTFVTYGPDGRPADAFPATGRTFAVEQTHWHRVRDGMVVEHWADRDDLGMARQLGWIPPTPPYIVKMQLATRRARRDHDRAHG